MHKEIYRGTHRVFGFDPHPDLDGFLKEKFGEVDEHYVNLGRNYGLFIYNIRSENVVLLRQLYSSKPKMQSDETVSLIGDESAISKIEKIVLEESEKYLSQYRT